MRAKLTFIALAWASAVISGVLVLLMTQLVIPTIMKALSGKAGPQTQGPSPRM